MATSKKPIVIDWIFNTKFDIETQALRDPVVTFDDVRRGIRATGVDLSESNPANFWKDLTRSNTRNQNWPTTVFAAGYTGADAIGEGDQACFKFVPVATGQAVPFPDAIPFDAASVQHQKVQSLSMPQATKALGRTDENWLAQVSSRLAVVETFFALFSLRSVLEVSFLQTGVKLRRGEVDAAFSITCDDGRWLVSAEAKGRVEPLHGPQIARAAFHLQQDAEKKPELQDIRGVVPLGLKVVDRSQIWVVEFEPVESADSALVVASQGVIELVPAVPGIR